MHKNHYLSNNLYLSGFMGVGKSTIGLELAKHLNMTFVDLDDEIETSLGMKITAIFKNEGEVFFRNQEFKVLQKISMGSGQVIALGGGTLLKEENRNIIKQSGFHIYLRAGVHTLADRLNLARGTRPLLERIAEEPLSVRVRILMKERKKFYEEADLIIDTDERLRYQTIQDILNAFRQRATG